MAGEGLIGLGQVIAGGTAGYVAGLDQDREYQLHRQQMDINKTMADIQLGNYQMAKTAFDENLATRAAGDQFFMALGDTAEAEGRYATNATEAITAMKTRSLPAEPQAGGAAPVGNTAGKPIGIMTNGKEPKGYASLDPDAMVNTSNQYLRRYSEMRDQLSAYMEDLKQKDPQTAVRTRLSPQYQSYVNKMGSLASTADELRSAAAIVSHSKSIKGYLRAVQSHDPASQDKYRTELSKNFGEEFPLVVGATEDEYIVQPFYPVERDVKDPVSGKTVRKLVNEPMQGTVNIKKEVLDAWDPEIDPQKAFEIIAELRKASMTAKVGAEGAARVAQIGAESSTFDNPEELHLKASQSGVPMNPNDEMIAYSQAEAKLAAEHAAFLKRRLPQAGNGLVVAKPEDMDKANAIAEKAWESGGKETAIREVARVWGFERSKSGGADEGFYGWTIKGRSPNAVSLVDRAKEILTQSKTSKRGAGGGGGIVAPRAKEGLGAGNPTGIPVS